MSVGVNVHERASRRHDAAQRSAVPRNPPASPVPARSRAAPAPCPASSRARRTRALRSQRRADRPWRRTDCPRLPFWMYPSCLPQRFFSACLAPRPRPPVVPCSQPRRPITSSRDGASGLSPTQFLVELRTDTSSLAELRKIRMHYLRISPRKSGRASTPYDLTGVDHLPLQLVERKPY